MSNYQEVNAALSKFATQVPEVGDSKSIAVSEVLAALGTSDAASALKTFETWAENNGMKTMQLTIGVVVLGRHLA
jgi:hypothetical protein